MQVSVHNYSKFKCKVRVRKTINAFLEYKGNDTWSGSISGSGLSLLRTQLNKVASRNTKVACFYSSYGTEKLMWTIGEIKLSETASYPISTTKHVHTQDKKSLLGLKQGLVGVAAMWHDLGKSNSYFQDKLAGKVPVSDPVRHEWVSAVIVKTFADSCSDWLTEDFTLPETSHMQCVYGEDEVLQVILWLINTHHKKALVSDEFSRTVTPEIRSVLKQVNASQGWVNRTEDLEKCYYLDDSFITHLYTKQLNRYRKKLKENLYLWKELGEDQKLHLLQECRVALMLGDSNYSSQLEYGKGELYANLDHEGNFKQTLSQHLLGVTQYALSALYKLNTIKVQKSSYLPKLNSKSPENFKWQDRIKDIPENLDNMFCINLASTGKGKTVANLKVLQQFGNIRASVGLGMVSLTKQTTSQFYNVVGLDQNDMAMVVGFKQGMQQVGSESLDQDELDIRYSGQISNLSGIFPNNNSGIKNTKVLNAPVLVTTTDHLIKATGVLKGNKHMLPFVRCMQSDLVLDEIDDYGIEDMKTLARLVNLTASYGNKVIISSATITPAISNIFYEAYKAGWKVYCKNSGKEVSSVNVLWLDEFAVSVKQVSDQFSNLNTRFVNKRISQLLGQSPKHKAKVVEGEDLVETVKSSINTLHTNHSVNGISYGVARVTTIKDCVNLTQELQKWDTDLNVKLLCYHSRFLQATKDQMEQFLTQQLNRKNPDNFYTGAPTVYIVVATPVVEVGRDFDFDWAIIEPSSERSIVQTAGRVLRHRSPVPENDNIHILPHPFKYYRNQKVCYDTAGYESKGYPLNSKNMLDIYEQNSIVNSVNRLKGEVGGWKKSLVKLEHKVLTDSLTCVESDTNVFTGGWGLTGNPHHFCKWRRGVKQKVVDIVQGEWQDTQVVTKNYSSSKIWRKWDSATGRISFPEYLQDKTIGYNEFYGGYEVEN